jgi:alanine racemase
VRQPVNIVSHFARADEPECGATERQLDIFTTFCEGKPGMRSIAASGGILLWPQSHFDWARPGIILYGVSPLENKPWGPDFGFQPVMSLVSSLIAVREHKAGEPVGYGGPGSASAIRVSAWWRWAMATAIRAPRRRVRRCWSMAAKCRLLAAWRWI